MNGKQRYIGLVIFLVAAISAMVWAYGFVTNRQQGPDGMSIGVVRIDDVLAFNPSYADYKQAKNELELLQRQYELEQQALNAKSETQDEQLKTLALDSTLSDALTVELQTRIATKENELNQQLNAKRNELTQKYLSELKVSSNEYDLEIVNLQLDLYAYDARVYIDDAQKQAAMAEKAKKEERLKELLAKRKPSNLDVDSIKAKVQAELAPMQQKGQEELNQYAASLQKELAAKRDTMVQQQAQSIIANNNLPVAQDWNDSWAKKLSDKEAEVSAALLMIYAFYYCKKHGEDKDKINEEVNALHEAILEDVRMRVAIIAEEQHLDLVIIDDGGNIKGLDITDAVKASYRVQ